jgi:hypothetical protein
MEYAQQMKQAKDNALVGLYQNPGYQFERVKNKTITIHIVDVTATNAQYSLIEPLRVDKLSDVYIDSFISNDTITTAAASAVFVLGIKEFNIQSVSNNQSYHNKLIIPNTSGTAAVTNTVAHRATKFNYIGSVNPMTLSSLEISLTLANGTTALSGSGDIWLTFMIVARD